MKTRYFFKSIIAAAVVALSSCSINVPPPDLYSDPDAISNVKAARSLLTSCYELYPHYEYDLSTLGNDFCPTNLSGKDVNQQNLYYWQDNSISDFASESWLALYNCVANCDILLDRLPDIKTTTDAETAQLNAVKAEGETLKAMAYFDILRLFSSAYDNTADTAGIVIKSRTGVEVVPRRSKKESVEYIKSLLTDAASVDNHPSANGWLSQTAAQYLLAEVSLWANQWLNAASYAQNIIDNCDMTMFTPVNYNRLWADASFSGRIFAFYLNNSFYSSIQYSETEGDYYALNPDFANFDDNDGRKGWTVYEMDMDGKTRSLFGKYNRMNKENTSIQYDNRMRYAGAFFIAAEAYARQGQDERAITTLNAYLNTIGSNPIDESLTGNDLIDRILQEKYKEFVGEGQNWFDLKRTHRGSLQRLLTWGSSVRSRISTDDYRWTLPIPASEYRYNDAVTQNPGWPINRE